MSDQTVTPNTDAPKVKRAPKVSQKRITHSAAIAAWAKAHPSDPTGKGFRAHMRRNFADMAKSDPKSYGSKGTKRATNDRVPWPNPRVDILVKVFAHDVKFVAAVKAVKS